jgi:glycerol-3-phosphate dehydrogenase (NAD(P)+)
MSSITVLGGGSWGTALATVLAHNGHDVMMWIFEKDIAHEINTSHTNETFLKDITLSERITATDSLEKACRASNTYVSVIPSQHLREVLTRASGYISDDGLFISCTKGVEIETSKLMSEIIIESVPHISTDSIVVLSGPSFAREVASQHPTTVVVASTNKESATKAQELFRTEFFLPFIHDDIIGVQMGGAVKNIIAIACGMSDGLGFGDNTRAAIITRSLYEMIKLGQALGANPITFSGLSGIGDLVLTCTGSLSRNRSVGLELGKGRTIKEILGSMKMVAEGVDTTRAIHRIMQEKNINAPICNEMYNILFENKSPRQAVEDLTRMDIKEELRSVAQ